MTTHNRQDSAAANEAGSTDGLESAIVEFTKEEVEALLTEKLKAPKFPDYKVNCLLGVLFHVMLVVACTVTYKNVSFTLMTVFDLLIMIEQKKTELLNEKNKRLKLCVRWFQRREEENLAEHEKLRSALEFSEKKCTDAGTRSSIIFFLFNIRLPSVCPFSPAEEMYQTANFCVYIILEMEMKAKVEELNRINSEFQRSIALLEGKLETEESAKMVSSECVEAFF